MTLDEGEPGKRAEAKRERDRRIVELSEAGRTQREIGEEVGVVQKTVGNVLSKNGSTSIFTQNDAELVRQREDDAELVRQAKIEGGYPAAKLDPYNDD